jgi:hypothetical protein
MLMSGQGATLDQASSPTTGGTSEEVTTVSDRQETTMIRPDTAERVEPTLRWLEQEFPEWIFSIDETATWEGDLRPLWIARRPGHHPQAELTAAKLHTRLTDYLQRSSRRQALTN